MTRFEHMAKGAYVSVFWRDELTCWDPEHARRILYLTPVYSARVTLGGIDASRMRLLPALLVLERDDSWLAGVGVVLTRWAGCNTPLDLLRITLGLAKRHGILGQAGYQLALSEVKGFMHAVIAAKRNSNAEPL